MNIKRARKGENKMRDNLEHFKGIFDIIKVLLITEVSKQIACQAASEKDDVINKPLKFQI
jgi:hypothetical protein